MLFALSNRVRSPWRAALLAGLLGAAPALWGARWDDPATGAPLLQVFGPRDLGSAGASRCAITSRDGHLYVANDDVLAYDGENWQRLAVPGTFEVLCLAEDSAGRLWVGGVGQIGWFEPWEKGTRRFVSALDRLPFAEGELGEVSNLFIEAGDAVVFVTPKRVVRLRGTEVGFWSLPSARQPVAWQDATGEVLVARPGADTFRVGPHGPVSAYPEPLASTGVTWEVRFPGGSSLLGTGAGLVRRLATGGYEPAGGPLAARIPAGEATTAVGLPGGFAAIGTANSGVIVADATGRILASLDRSSGLPADKIVQLAADGDGRVLVTTSEGIAVFCSNLEASVFDARHGLPPGRITAIAANPFGGPAPARPILRTAQGLGILHPSATGPGHGTAYRPFATSDAAKGGLPPIDDLLLVATDQGGAVLEDATPTLGWESDTPVRLIAKWTGAAGGVVWVEGTQLYHGFIDNRRLRPVAAPVQLPAAPSSLIEDARGAFWLGNARAGVIRVAAPGDSTSPSRVRRRFSPEELGIGPAEAPRVFRCGNELLVASGSALLIHSPTGDVFRPIAGVRNLQVHAATRPDPDGTVWLAVGQRDVHPAQVRIARVRPLPSGGVECELVRLPSLPFEEAPTALFAEPAAAGPERIFWMGLPGRVVRIVSPGTSAAAPLSPEIVALTAIGPDNTTRSLPVDGASLAFANSGLRYEVRVPGGRRRHRVAVETRLSGVDQQWVPLGRMPVRVFRGLRDLSYRFEARTVDALGRPSAAVAATFTVLPPWWRTVPAYLGYALVLVLGSALLFFARLRIVRARQRHLESLVAQRTEELARANAAKSDYLAHINHEIRNPLNGVVGLAEMLARREDDGESRELARALRACADYLGSVVDSVLDLARIEAGRLELTPSRFEPRALLDGVAAMFRLHIEDAGGRLHVTIDPSLPPALVGDCHRIRQVLVNFTANALRHARGSEVRLSARLRTRTADEVTVVFAVADAGPGIPAGDQARLFTRFARGAASARVPDSGYGVGLSLVRSLAGVLGGNAAVDSLPGFGSRFTLDVPLRVAPPEPPAPDPAGSAPAGTLRVLVTDDQACNRLVLRDQLERLGCRVEEAGDGPSALLLLEARAHHLAFIDLDLPGLDGLSLIARLRRTIGAGETPFLVAISAYATRHTEEAALAAGAHAFLPKPLATARIAVLVRECGDARVLAPAACTPDPATGWFDPTAAGSEVLQALAEDLDTELQGLRQARGRTDADAIRRHTHRLASLALIARDGDLLQHARSAEDALRLGQSDVPGVLSAVESSAQARLEALRETPAG